MNPYLVATSALPRDREGRILCSRRPLDTARTTDPRWSLCQQYSWAIPNSEALATIKAYARGRGVIEIGAGTGYWGMLLAAKGVDVAAFDARPPEADRGETWNFHHPHQTCWFPVEKGGPEKIDAHPGRLLLLCWPPPERPFASDCLLRYRGDLLFFVGEDRGGWTGDETFFDILERDWSAERTVSIPQWAGANDKLVLYRRRAASGCSTRAAVDAPRLRVSNGRLPTFLIVGAPRAGTTSVAHHLGCHPNVYVPLRKEISFFDTPERYEKGLEWYRRQFRGAGPVTAVGDASPNYMSAAHSIPRIAHHLPDTRLIAILRNPVERAYSHYWLNCHWYGETRDFYEAVFLEAAGFEGSASYLAQGLYASDLEHVCEYVPRSQLLVVFFEEFRANPRAVLSDICRFIGVAPEGLPENVGEALNTPHRPRWLPLWRAVEFGRHRSDNLGRAIRTLDSWQVRPAPYPPMDPRARRRLEEWYEGPNAALASWLGRELPWSHPLEASR